MKGEGLITHLQEACGLGSGTPAFELLDCRYEVTLAPKDQEEFVTIAWKTFLHNTAAQGRPERRSARAMLMW